MLKIVNPTTTKTTCAIDGNIMISKNNPENGSIMVEQPSMGLGNGGFLEKPRTGFIKDTVANLKKLTNEQLTFICKNSHIIIEESHTPFYEGQQPKMNPSTQELLTKDGQPIYRQTTPVSIHSGKEDKLIHHDKVGIQAFTPQINVVSNAGVVAGTI